MKGVRWEFRSRFRSRAYGWRGSAIAIKRLKEAVQEIKRASKAAPLPAGEGVVALVERLWPALMDVDTSSGALGAAVYRTLEQLIPLLVAAPADVAMRRSWLERLNVAVMDDGVDYLAPIQDRWGEIAVYPELMLECVEQRRPLIHDVWSGALPPGHVIGASSCFSCLLELGLYGDLIELLADDPTRSWHARRYGAQALARQKMWDTAIAYAEGSRHKRGYDDRSIDRFCEGVLIESGRVEDAFRRYGLRSASGPTYLASFRDLAKRYPSLDPRRLLIELIETRGERGKWFAAAKEAGLLDIALACAQDFGAEPATLARAVRDYSLKEPVFAFQVGLAALDHLLWGGGYDVSPVLVGQVFADCVAAASAVGALDLAMTEARRLAERPCGPGLEPMRQRLAALIVEATSSAGA